MHTNLLSILNKEQRRQLATLAFILGTCFVYGCSSRPPTPSNNRLDNLTSWWCYYGDDRRVLSSHKELLILESAGIGRVHPDDHPQGPIICYISIGELDTWRDESHQHQGKSWVLEPNKHWPESHFVDVRAEEWQQSVLAKAAERLALGYDGLFLDTIDTADFLLDVDPIRFKNIDRAMIHLISRLRQQFPNSILIANGGATLSHDIGPLVDAWMQEDLGTHYDTITNKAAATSEDHQTWARQRLSVMKALGRPVLGLDYFDDNRNQATVLIALKPFPVIPMVGHIDLKLLPSDIR